MINRPDDLWCKVIYSTYGRNIDLQASISIYQRQALVDIANQFCSHLVSQVGDGQQINFWLDNWMSDGHSFMNFSTQQTIDTTLTVKDTLTDTGEWEIIFLTTNLPHTTVNQLVAIPAPKDTDGPDILGWRGTNTHQLTVQSAYNLQRRNYLFIYGNWKSLWSLKGSHIIQTFM
jgi:hypothetical protein